VTATRTMLHLAGHGAATILLFLCSNK